MATGDKRNDPVTGEPEIELADGSWATDWNELKDGSAIAISGSFHSKITSAGVQSFAEEPTTSLIVKQPDNQTLRLQGGAEYRIQMAFSKNDNSSYVAITASEDGVVVASAATGGAAHWKGGSSFVHRVSIPEGETRDYIFNVGQNGGISALSGSVDIEAQKLVNQIVSAGLVITNTPAAGQSLQANADGTATWV